MIPRTIVLALLLLIFSLAVPVHGETPSPARVAVFLVSEPPAPRWVRSLLLRGMEAALKKNPRLDVKNTDLLLAEFGGEIPQEDVTRAQGLARRGKKLLFEGRSGDAEKVLLRAEAAYEAVLAFTSKAELAEVQFLLGVAQARAGKDTLARETFARLQTWRPGYVVDVERFSAVLPLWERAASDVQDKALGSLEVLSEPDGALAFVDGRFIGTTPTTVDGLPVGDHYVTLVMEGHERRVLKAHVDAKYQELVTEHLPKLDKYLLVEQSLGRARNTLGDEEADVALVDLRSFLFLDMVVVLDAEPGKGRRGARVGAYLYDLRSKRLLAQVTGAAIPKLADRVIRNKLGEVSDHLFRDVRYDGKSTVELVASGGDDREGERSPPVYRRWWFWSAAAAVVGLAVAAPFVVDFGEDGPTCPAAHTCGEVLLDY